MAADLLIFPDRVMLDCDADKLSQPNHDPLLALLPLSVDKLSSSELDSGVLCDGSTTS